MKEIRFQGLGISPGVAIGKAFVLEMAKPVVWMHRIQNDEVEIEIERLRKAIEATKQGLGELKGEIGKEMGQEHAYIFDAHLLMLEDPILVEGTIERITKHKVNAEFALQQVTKELSQTFSSFEDSYLRERSVDVLDVSNRIQWQLCKPLSKDRNEPDEPSILLAHDIHPSKLASMDTANVLGMALDVGGQTTHTGLLATAKGIPAVVGLRDISVLVKPGDLMIIDGGDGSVIVKPGKETLEKYKKKEALLQQRDEELIELSDVPAVTTDGVEITMLANVELKEELEPAYNKFGAKGIGLYRSEFVYLSNPRVLPTELDHEQMYASMAAVSRNKPINLRTMDLGGEKNLEAFDIGVEQNPALGLRAVRFSLRNKSIFKQQIRGALRASTSGNIRLMAPMISGVGEFRTVKELVEECSLELMKEGIPINEDIQIGVMIEIPSAAIIADLLAAEADFVSVGTNDLIQYLLAIDRGNESVAYLYEPFHPAVLRTLADIAKKVKKAGKPFSMCGEMAADPIATPLLIGLGYTELSMNPLSIPVIKSVIRSISAKMCREFAEKALEIPSVTELYRFMRENLDSHYQLVKDIKLGIPFGEKRK